MHTHHLNNILLAKMGLVAGAPDLPVVVDVVVAGVVGTGVVIVPAVVFLPVKTVCCVRLRTYISNDSGSGAELGFATIKSAIDAVALTVGSRLLGRTANEQLIK